MKHHLAGPDQYTRTTLITVSKNPETKLPWFNAVKRFSKCIYLVILAQIHCKSLHGQAYFLEFWVEIALSINFIFDKIIVFWSLLPSLWVVVIIIIIIIITIIIIIITIIIIVIITSSSSSEMAKTAPNLKITETHKGHHCKNRYFLFRNVNPSPQG